MGINVSFPDYFRRLHPSLASTRPQLSEVADLMQSFWDNGKTMDVLNISLPTRFGKSLLSTSFSSWLLVFRNKKARILRASYAAELAESFSQQVRTQTEYAFFNLGIKIKTEGTRNLWRIAGNTEDNHCGVGVSGGSTGFGFDIAIVDDTAKNMVEAMSAAYSRNLKLFKESVLLGRMETDKKIINVGTRWTVNDWFSLWPDATTYTLPAIINGHSCCESWKTTEELELDRDRVSSDVWDAQWMQRPTATGRIRLFEGWRPEALAEIPEGKHVLVIDPTTDYGKDWFVIGDYVRVAGFVYLCGMFAKKKATTEEAAAWCKGRDYSVAWIETNGVGADVLNKMRKNGCRNMAGFSTSADKYSRAWLQMDNIKNYFRIFAGVDQDAARELLVQADEFPAGVHDDLIDNVVMAFERFRI